MSISKREDELTPTVSNLDYIKNEVFKTAKDSRIVIFNSDVNRNIIETVWFQIEHIIVSDEDKSKPVYLYINSEGGYEYEALFLCDYIRSCQTPIYTIGMGYCMSAAFYILISGHKRLCYKNTVLMTHDSHVGIEEKMPAVRSIVKHFDKLDEAFTKIMTEQSELEAEFIEQNISSHREWYISTNDAKKWGLVDKVITPTFTHKTITKITDNFKKENAKKKKKV